MGKWKVCKSSKIKHPWGSGGLCPLDQRETQAHYLIFRICYFCQITPLYYTSYFCFFLFRYTFFSPCNLEVNHIEGIVKPLICHIIWPEMNLYFFQGCGEAGSIRPGLHVADRPGNTLRRDCWPGYQTPDEDVLHQPVTETEEGRRLSGDSERPRMNIYKKTSLILLGIVLVELCVYFRHSRCVRTVTEFVL